MFDTITYKMKSNVHTLMMITTSHEIFVMKVLQVMSFYSCFKIDTAPYVLIFVYALSVKRRRVSYFLEQYYKRYKLKSTARGDLLVMEK